MMRWLFAVLFNIQPKIIYKKFQGKAFTNQDFCATIFWYQNSRRAWCLSDTESARHGRWRGEFQSMPKQLALLLAAVLTVGLVTACSPSGEESSQSQSSSSSQSQSVETTGSSDYLFEEGSTLLQFTKPADDAQIAVVTTSMGEIQIMFFPEQAPKAVENFTTLAEKGYYNGLRFHRVIDGFMIQGGDPNGNGTGGQSIWGEPFEDEFSKELHNFRGALSMANSGENTNGSQFFIVQANTTDPSLISQMNGLPDVFSNEVAAKYEEIGGTPWLDYRHTVFGQVIKGMDVVDAIAGVETDANDMPVDDVIIENIEFKTFGELYNG